MVPRRYGEDAPDTPTPTEGPGWVRPPDPAAGPIDYERCVAGMNAAAGRIADALAGLAPGVPVPSCPGWTATDLARHVGQMHRGMGSMIWAAAGTAPQQRPAAEPPEQLTAQSPEGGQAAAVWVRACAEDLAAAFAAADPDKPATRGWRPDATVRFWARRMLYDTVVHAADAELTAGDDRPHVAPWFARDGIDEFFELLAALPAERRKPGEPITVAVCDPQARIVWRFDWRPPRMSVARTVVPAEGEQWPGDVALWASDQIAGADAWVSGPVGAVFLWLWGRAAGAVHTGGDVEALARWRAAIAV